MLLDCTLPGGLDPHLMPTADQSGVPVILMSGHPEMVERVAGAGRPFILKPFSLNCLLSTLQGVITASPSHDTSDHAIALGRGGD